jgi:hypothetical protein
MIFARAMIGEGYLTAETERRGEEKGQNWDDLSFTGEDRLFLCVFSVPAVKNAPLSFRVRACLR